MGPGPWSRSLVLIPGPWCLVPGPWSLESRTHHHHHHHHENHEKSENEIGHEMVIHGSPEAQN
eukprot:4055063-Karenia_brevis.AAC.1